MRRTETTLARTGAGDRTPANMASPNGGKPTGALGLNLHDGDPGDGLALVRLAEFVRTAYPECQRHFRSYQEYRFAIGMALLKARDLLAIGPGERNATGRNQQSGRPVDTLSTGQIGNGLKTRGGPRNGQEEAGLMNWCRREFPEIHYRTLTRYRSWVEFEVLPLLQKCRDQLELDLGDPRDLDVFALPAPKREQLVRLLKEATTARDMTLTLRAQGDAKGDPEQYGPLGGDNTPRDGDGNRIQRPRRELHEQKVARANAHVGAMVERMVMFEEKTAAFADLADLAKLVQVADEFAKAARIILEKRQRALR